MEADYPSDPSIHRADYPSDLGISSTLIEDAYISSVSPTNYREGMKRQDAEQ